MSQPLVSIIIPVYNVEKYLFQCLNSVIQQTYNEIEIICVNDGSNDNSLNILLSVQKIDERLKIFNRQNRGVSAARNFGIDKAKGEFVFFMDSDDWIELDTIFLCITRILKEKADCILFSYIREFGNVSLKKNILNKEKIYVGEEMVQLHRKIIGPINQELSEPEKLDSLGTIWGKLYRLDIIKKNKIKFTDLIKIGTAEDVLFNIEYFNYVRKALYLESYLYHYRKINSSSITSVYKNELPTQWKHLFESISNLIKELRLEKKNKLALNNRISLSIIGLGLNELQNPKGFLSAYKNIKLILNNEQLKKAFANLELKYFSIHWWLFFAFAKYRFVFGVYLFLVAINYFVNKNK